MQLPLTLSVIRALLVEIAGEIYAFPLARIDHTLKLDKEPSNLVEGRQYFSHQRPAHRHCHRQLRYWNSTMRRMTTRCCRLSSSAIATTASA